jgi:hypothetical protein
LSVPGAKATYKKEPKGASLSEGGGLYKGIRTVESDAKRAVVEGVGTYLRKGGKDYPNLTRLFDNGVVDKTKLTAAFEKIAQGKYPLKEKYLSSDFAEALGQGYWDGVWQGGLIPWLETRAPIAASLSPELSGIFKSLLGLVTSKAGEIWNKRVELLTTPATHEGNELNIKADGGKAANRWAVIVTLGEKT